MDSDTATVDSLKTRLLSDVAYLCRRADRVWSEPIVRTVREMRAGHTNAVFFGGTLRSLLLSRIERGRLGRPRDVDIVVRGTTLDALRERFQRNISRETRFGGLQLQRKNWHFDLWPLERTWAFTQDRELQASFAALPYTTFFNLEAIAVDVWAQPGGTRTVYSGDGQFFDGLLSRTIEINREPNPFPQLCVVRALVMAWYLRFAVGPRLAKYLALHGPQFCTSELERTQRQHYGKVRVFGDLLNKLIIHIQRAVDANSDLPVRLPFSRQTTLWAGV